jgi:hypothetical protein
VPPCAAASPATQGCWLVIRMVGFVGPGRRRRVGAACRGVVENRGHRVDRPVDGQFTAAPPDSVPPVAGASTCTTACSAPGCREVRLGERIRVQRDQPAGAMPQFRWVSLARRSQRRTMDSAWRGLAVTGWAAAHGCCACGAAHPRWPERRPWPRRAHARCVPAHTLTVSAGHRSPDTPCGHRIARCRRRRAGG